MNASIQMAWTMSLDGVRVVLDADTANDPALLLRATSQELGATRDAVIDTAVRRLEMSQKQAAEAFTLVEEHESNPLYLGLRAGTDATQSAHALAGRSVRARRAASRLVTTVH